MNAIALIACSAGSARRARTRITARMTMSVVATALLAAAPLAQGCATTSSSDDAETGEIVVSLVQPGPQGEIYHLANATFDVTTELTGAVTTVDGGGISNQVAVSMPPGLTDVRLRDGWTLEKSTDGGATFQPVSALLGSPNPNVIRVLANQPSFMEFAFLIRNTNGTLRITLGIVTNPRELAGGFLVRSATDALANYAVFPNRNFDFGTFFNLFSLESVALDDGTKQRIYTAFGQQGSLGPVPLRTAALATEFYNDNLGILSGPVATDMTGGFLQYTVAARPDGTVELSGTLSGSFTSIDFSAPSTIDAIIPTLDPDGFPNDEFFYDTTVPFTLTSALPGLEGTATGIMRMRHLLPQE